MAATSALAMRPLIVSPWLRKGRWNGVVKSGVGAKRWAVVWRSDELGGQTVVKRWSNGGQPDRCRHPVKRRSEGGQTVAKLLSNGGQKAAKLRSNGGQTMVNMWSKGGQAAVKWRSNDGQHVVKRRSSPSGPIGGRQAVRAIEGTTATPPPPRPPSPHALPLQGTLAIAEEGPIDRGRSLADRSTLTNAGRRRRVAR